MKKIVFFSLVIAMTIGSCAKEEKSPIEGAWQVVYGQWIGVQGTFPDQVKGSQIKMWSKEHYIFVGHVILDTLIYDNYGWGTYTLDGDKYQENVVIHNGEPNYQTLKLLLEIRNDTLIQQWPADDNWKLAEKYSTEKYVRVK